MTTKYIAVPLTRDQGVARAIAAAAAVKGTLVDNDGDGDLDVDDVIVETPQAVREHQRIPCYYGLGAGGGDANTDWPWNKFHKCDCSAALGWFIGQPRGNGDWGTTKILSDAYKMQYAPTNPDDLAEWQRGEPKPMINVGPGAMTRFEPVPKDEPVLPGDILIIAGVYRRQVSDHKIVRVSPGHIEMFSRFDDDFVRKDFTKTGYKNCGVIGCSPYKSAMFGSGHAIAETNAKFGRTRGYIIRFKGWVAA